MSNARILASRCNLRNPLPSGSDRRCTTVRVEQCDTRINPWKCYTIVPFLLSTFPDVERLKQYDVVLLRDGHIPHIGEARTRTIHTSIPGMSMVEPVAQCTKLSRDEHNVCTCWGSPNQVRACF